MAGPVGAEALLLARVLWTVEPPLRPALADRLVAEAAQAARQSRAGDRSPVSSRGGTLMARCHQLSPRPEPFARDPDFLTALLAACEALLRHSRP